MLDDTLVDEITFLCAWMATIAGFITPLWFGILRLIQLWGDRRDMMPKPAKYVRKRKRRYEPDADHHGVEE